jgi:hypothetical protein
VGEGTVERGRKMNLNEPAFSSFLVLKKKTKNNYTWKKDGRETVKRRMCRSSHWGMIHVLLVYNKCTTQDIRKCVIFYFYFFYISIQEKKNE